MRQQLMPGAVAPASTSVRLRLTLVITLVCLANAALAQPRSADPIDTFASALRSAVARDDRDTVAAMIAYPITVSVGGVRVPVPNREASA